MGREHNKTKNKKSVKYIYERYVFNKVFPITLFALLAFCIFVGIAAANELDFGDIGAIFQDEATAGAGLESGTEEFGAEGAGIESGAEEPGAEGAGFEETEPEGAGIEGLDTEGAGAEESGTLLTEEDQNLVPTDGFIDIRPMAAGDLWDLINFQEGFVIRNEEGVPLPPTGEFVNNKTYNFEVYFEAPQFVGAAIAYPAYDDGWLRYQLPAGVEVLNTMSGSIWLGGDTSLRIGEYIIDGDAGSGSVIYVKFDDIKV